MATILAVLIALFGTQHTERCYTGDITLYEDMSYTIAESETVAICDLWQTDSTIDYTRIEVTSEGYSFTTVHYVAGMPFPESVVTDSHTYRLLDTMQ